MPYSLRGGIAAARLLGLRVRMPPGLWMSVSCECCVLSGRGLSDGLITRAEGPTECGVSECDRVASIMRRPWPTRDCCAMGEYIPILILMCKCEQVTCLMTLSVNSDCTALNGWMTMKNELGKFKGKGKCPNLMFYPDLFLE